MQSHAHPNRAVREGALAVRGGGDGIRSPAEGDEERVTLRVYLDAVVRGEGGPETSAMLVQGLSVAVAELMQQPRRALHIREQQSDDTGGEVERHCAG